MVARGLDDPTCIKRGDHTPSGFICYHGAALRHAACPSIDCCRFPSIVPLRSVTPGAPPGQAGQLATMGSELFELLEVLTTQAPPEAHIVLARLPPFPDLPALEEMRRIQDTMKEGLTVAEVPARHVPAPASG